MTAPSILEIILMSVIGLCVLLYLIKSIHQIIDRKKNPEKYKNKEEEKRKKLDE